MTKIKTISSKLGLSAVALFFALGFGFGGVGVGVLPMAKMLTGWWRAQSMVAVPARIEKLELKRHDGESTTWQVQGEFVYQYQGREFRSHRINIGGDSSDNIGSYQKDRYAELQRVQTEGQNISLWVDPQQPEFAVVDKQIRLNRFLFLIPFAILFPGVAIAACWALWAIWRTPILDTDTASEQTSGQKWAASSQLGTLTPTASGALAGGLFALVWNMISLPMVLLALTDGGSKVRWLLVVFPIGGTVVAYFSARVAYLRWRVGKTALSISQSLCIGDTDKRVRLQFLTPLGQRMRTPSMSYEATFNIECLYEDSRSDDTDRKILWTEELATCTVMHAASSLDFSLSLPDNMPASLIWDKNKQKVIWKLRIQILNHELEFILPVMRGSGSEIGPAAIVDMVARLPRAGVKPVAITQDKSDAIVKSDSRRGWLAIWIGITVIVSIVFFWYDILREEFGPASQVPAQKKVTVTQLRQSVKEGLNVNLVDSEGKTLLMRAAAEADLEKVRFLLDQGAQVNAATPVNDQGLGNRTALFDAIQEDAVDIVAALVDADADTRLASNKVWTPVHYAAYAGAIKSMRYLHGRGLSIDEPFRGARGSTPLMVAAQYSQLPVISYLLEAGADRTRKDNHGEDACGYARYFKQAESARALSCP